MISKSIYLAGPDVFLPNSLDHFAELKKLCRDYGFIGLSPFDTEKTNEKLSNLSGIETAKRIFTNNFQLIQNSEYILANCCNFRGPLVDDGTSWEIGCAFALGKTIFAYLPQKVPLVENVVSRIQTNLHVSGYPIDEDGYLVNEDFGNSINLMLEFSIENSGGKLVEGNFEDCLKAIFEYEKNKGNKP